MSITDRIPPRQRVVADFPVLHVGPVPKFEPESWELAVEGLVAQPWRWSYQEFLQLPRTVSISDFHCVTEWSRLDNCWEGVSFRTIADLVKPFPQARYVTLECDGGYFTSLPLADLLEEGVLLAYRLDGQELSAEHGWPLRLVVPRKYAYKSAKWVRRLRFTQEQEPGYWEQQGYSNSADPWKEERYATA